MKEDELSESVRQALREVDQPPVTPREEMWSRIQAQRVGDVVPAAMRRDVIDLRPRRRVVMWAGVSAALAATLVLAFGVGRMTSATRPGNEAPATSTADATLPATYQLVAVQHLRRTETLLTSLTVDHGLRSADEMQSAANELLTNTRLLLASVAADDAPTRRLLEDLELVLTQIAVMPAAQVQEEMELIREGLNQSDVLLRVRAAIAGPRLVGT